MAEPSRRYNLIDRRKKPQGVVLKRWEVEYSKLINNENRRVPLETVKSAIRSAFEDDLFEQWRITLKCQARLKRAFELYIETVLSTLPDAMQVELLRDGSFTEVHEEFVVPNVINDEEPFVQESNTPSSDVKQENLEDDDEYITLSDGEDESIDEIAIVDMKPISLMPLNMDIKPKITSSSEPEQIHSGEDQEIQDQHNADKQNANISRKTQNFNGDENDEIETNKNDQNCSTVKSEPEGVNTSAAEILDQNYSVTNTQANADPEDVNTSEVEYLGTTKIQKKRKMNKRKASSKSAENTSHSKLKFEPYFLHKYCKLLL
ncbi:hypothetical protein DdX_19401 [Ditylenchus destructor]|uniref:Uncharacterized protein n=1 Tax=Ditylenchus destructor TaxID=166010 RepID=A0AAD4MMN9_9BILA|nr:hypothetical protein DdX_19401 [Ditylenchus destructor]